MPHLEANDRRKRTLPNGLYRTEVRDEARGVIQADNDTRALVNMAAIECERLLFMDLETRRCVRLVHLVGELAT